MSPQPDDDEDDPWKLIEQDIFDRHCIRNDTMKTYCPLCRSTGHVLVCCPQFDFDFPTCQYCLKWSHFTLDCKQARFDIYNQQCNNSTDTSTLYKTPTTWDEWVRGV